MDLFGQALTDQFLEGKADTLNLYTSLGDLEEMPLDLFFRAEEEMPELERYALELCHGKVLDIGAGVGSHALFLQKNHIDVTALDISPAACDIMQQRGVNQVICGNIDEVQLQKYDTLLMLMNGIGVFGKLKSFSLFLERAKNLINEGGQLLFDSSDITYAYEDGPLPGTHYFGEVSYQYEYKGIKGNWFDWLFIDQATLISTAYEAGWTCEVLYVDENDQYLARLFLPKSLQY
jgi:cyclopropane fatty-acyl-phospholipid synthase-like methyltransferase